MDAWPTPHTMQPALMARAAYIPPGSVCKGRIVGVIRQHEAINCILADRARVLLPLFVASHIAIGDEITFPVPGGEAVGPEVYIAKAPSSGTRRSLYVAPMGYVTQPKLDKRDQSFVSAQVRSGSLGISSVFLPCETVREYFYGVGDSKNGSVSASLYQTLHIGTSASPAEIRVAFKLRSLELNTIEAARSEQVKLERAFNILGHPELRDHYDALLTNPETPALFPYGGFGSLLLMGERSRQGDIFFARQILAFVPEQRHQRFHLAVRKCEFYADKALCRDARRKLQFWLDPALVHVSWDPSWNRWKHLLSSKLEVDGVLFGVANTKSETVNGNLWIGKLDCRAGFRSRFRPIFRRTSREHELCTADLASILVLWIKSGCAWSIRRLNEKTWSECVQNKASPATSMSLRSVGVRITISSSIANSRVTLDGSISSEASASSISKR